MSRIMTFVSLLRIIRAVTVSFGKPYSTNICSNFPLSMEANALEKSRDNRVASRFFARIPSMIRRRVWIWEVVDRFLRKPSWFFFRNGKIHFYVYFFFYCVLHKSRKTSWNFQVFHISARSAAFHFLIALRTVSSSFLMKCLNSMSI